MPRNKEQNIWVKRLVTGDEIAYKNFSRILSDFHSFRTKINLFSKSFIACILSDKPALTLTFFLMTRNL